MKKNGRFGSKMGAGAGTRKLGKYAGSSIWVHGDWAKSRMLEGSEPSP